MPNDSIMTEIWAIYFASRKLSQHPEKKHVHAYGSVSFLLGKYILNIILFLYPNPLQTRQTLATGVGFLGVGICQLTPTPMGTRSHNPCRFVNLSYSLLPTCKFIDRKTGLNWSFVGLHKFQIGMDRRPDRGCGLYRS